MPMSNLCPANKSRNSTKKSSRAWLACLSTVKSVQSKLDKIWSRDSWLTCGSSCSSFCKAISSPGMRFCIGVCWVSILRSWSVGSQYVSLDFSDKGSFRNGFTYCMASSRFVSKRWRKGAGLIALINFVCSGVSIYRVVMWHPFFCVYGCSKKKLLSTVNCLFWVVVNTAQMMRSS